MEMAPKAFSFSRGFRFNLFGRATMSLLESQWVSPGWLTHCLHSLVLHSLHVCISDLREQPQETPKGIEMHIFVWFGWRPCWYSPFLFLSHMLCLQTRSTNGACLFYLFISNGSLVMDLLYLLGGLAFFNFSSKLHNKGTFIYLCKQDLDCISLSSYFFSRSWRPKSLAAVFFSEDGTEHSDVNLKSVWFWKHPWRHVW